MPKKILLTSAKANMIWQFNKRNIKILQSLRFQVHVATNFEQFGSMSADENEKLKKWMHENGVIAHQVDYLRKLGSMSANLKSYRQLREIIKTNHIDVIHAHSHMAGVLGRLAAHKEGIPAIYTPHGFYFFRGGPKKNWLIYPIEKFLSRYTDTLITIDKEEYDIARKHFDANRVVLIPGVGVDVVGAIAFSLEKKQRIRENTRCVLGLSDGDFAILSVGELSHRKNQEVILRAVAKLHNPRIKILVAGVGPLKSYLINLAKQLGISHQLQLLGYRNDLRALHFATDLFVFPSLREGLALAGLEAIVDGERIIGANIRGIRDYIIPSCGTMCQPRNIRQISELILDEMQPNRLSRINDKDIQNFFSSFDCGAVDSQMRDCYVLYAAK